MEGDSSTASTSTSDSQNTSGQVCREKRRRGPYRKWLGHETETVDVQLQLDPAENCDLTASSETEPQVEVLHSPEFQDDATSQSMDMSAHDLQVSILTFNLNYNKAKKKKIL